jgi:hypothetical protein
MSWDLSDDELEAGLTIASITVQLPLQHRRVDLSGLRIRILSIFFLATRAAYVKRIFIFISASLFSSLIFLEYH